MYQEFKDVADFRIVYISEAHAMDDKYPVSYAKRLGINETKTYKERCTVAGRLKEDKKLTIPFVVDTMDGTVENHYKGWPTRVYLVRTDGKLGVAGKRGPWGLKPALKQAGAWLAEYKETGKEPELALVEDDQPDFMELQRSMMEALQAKDYEKALSYAKQTYDIMPDESFTAYNLACMHCLSGHEEETYTWLEKAIELGYDDADHLLEDDDLKSIRDQERFKTSAGAGDVDTVLGDWEMKTALGGEFIDAVMSLSLKEGKLTGVWKSQGREMEMKNLHLDGDRLRFKRTIQPGQDLVFDGTIDGNRISGTYNGAFGELECTGKRTTGG